MYSVYTYTCIQGRETRGNVHCTCNMVEKQEVLYTVRVYKVEKQEVMFTVRVYIVEEQEVMYSVQV